MSIPGEIVHGLTASFQALNHSMGWMIWNTFLALVPWGLGLWLFRTQHPENRSARSRVVWWLGLAVCVAFLPNAPYVLTDVIHLIRFADAGTPVWMVSFVLIPQFFIFILIGTEAYTLTLLDAGHYLRRIGKSSWIQPMEWLVHGLCAFGIYLGRFPRFNSWDLISRPGSIFVYIAQEMWKLKPLVMMGAMFCAIALVYWLLKHITLALRLYLRSPEFKQALNNKTSA